MAILGKYIDVQRFEVIKRELNQLYARKSPVLLEEVPIELKAAVNTFITGRTMAVYQGKPSIHYGDFIEFFDFLWRK